MVEVTRSRSGRARRFGLGVVVLALAVGGYGLSTAQASNRGAAGDPVPLPPPTELASQLTVDIGVRGPISLPSRSIAPCDAQSPCPAGLCYTTIGVGKIVVQLNNPAGVPVTVRLARAFSRRMDARHTSRTLNGTPEAGAVPADRQDQDEHGSARRLGDGQPVRGAGHDDHADDVRDNDDRPTQSRARPRDLR